MNPKIRFERELRKNKKLCEFLTENNAYDKFIKNSIDFINTYKISDGGVISKMRRTKDPIIRAFEWSETPEGREYWENLCNKYCKII